MNNIIVTEEVIIGNVENIVEYFKEEIIRQTRRISLFDDSDCGNIENIQGNCIDYFELINGLHQDIITGYLEDEKCLIKIIYNDMGSWEYIELIERVSGGIEND